LSFAFPFPRRLGLGRRRGLSLIELVTVILILGIVTAVAGPRLGESLRQSRLRAAANQTASHVDYVRRAAITEGRAKSLQVNALTADYRSNEVDFPDQVGTKILVPVKQVYDPAIEIAADFDSQSELWFDWEGVPRVGAETMQSGTISIGFGDSVYDIVIAPGLGTTTVMRRPTIPTAEGSP
jgi:prepilin-type N-terminal cleavage/methylation domain-containing protein